MSRFFRIAIVIITLATFWILFAPFIGWWLIIEKPLEKADAIIVLGGSAVYRERSQKAAEMYRQGVAPKILLTDDGERAGWNRVEKTNLPWVELARRSLIGYGVPEEAIEILPGQVTGTVWEAKELATEVNRTGIKSVLIVTSAYHTRRSLWTFEKFLAGENVEIGIVHSPVGDQTPRLRSWWVTPRGWNMVAGEYVKFAAYWVYY
jgi:uncharacterized SAM-binding protein YcdF (DUF218 family)